MEMTDNGDGRQYWMTDNGNDRQWKWQTMEMLDNGNDKQ